MENKFKNRPNTCIKQDSKEHWLSRSCSVNGIVIGYERDNHRFSNVDYVLVVKRGKGAPDNVGKYCLPCGYLDYDETCYEAFLREVYEETGLYLSDYDDISGSFEINNEIQPVYVNSRTSNNRQNVAMFYMYRIDEVGLPQTSLEFNEPDEIEEAIWIKFTDVDKYEFCFGHDEIIKNIHKFIR